MMAVTVRARSAVRDVPAGTEPEGSRPGTAPAYEQGRPTGLQHRHCGAARMRAMHRTLATFSAELASARASRCPPLTELADMAASYG